MQSHRKLTPQTTEHKLSPTEIPLISYLHLYQCSTPPVASLQPGHRYTRPLFWFRKQKLARRPYLGCAGICGSNLLIRCAHSETLPLMSTDLMDSLTVTKSVCSTRATRDIYTPQLCGSQTSRRLPQWPSSSLQSMRKRRRLAPNYSLSMQRVLESHTYLASTNFSTSGLRKIRGSSLPTERLLVYSAISYPFSLSFMGLHDMADWARYKFSQGVQTHHKRCH